MQPVNPNSTTRPNLPKNTDKPIAHRVPAPQIPQENTTPITNTVTVIQDLDFKYTNWLKNAIEATPHLTKFIRLEQLLVILKAEQEILKTPDDPKNLSCDPQLIEATSPLLFCIQNGSEKTLINNMIALAQSLHEQREFFLKRLHKDCYPPYSPDIFPTFNKLLNTINCSNQQELKKLFRHDNFCTFLRCLLPLIKSYQRPYPLEIKLFMGTYIHKLQSLLSTPDDSIDNIRSHVSPYLLYLSNIPGAGVHIFTDMSFCNDDCAKRLAAWSKDPSTLERLEAILVAETRYMEELVQNRQKNLENFPVYQSLMHLKFRNTYDLPIFESGRLAQAYLLDQNSWEEAQESSIIKKFHLNTIKQETDIVTSCKRKNCLHFIYMKNPIIEKIPSHIAELSAYKETLQNPHLIEVYKGLIAALQLSEMTRSHVLHPDFSIWLQSVEILKDSHEADVAPFTARLNMILYQIFQEGNQQDEYARCAIPSLFSAFVQGYLDVLVEQWPIYQKNQKALLEYVQKQKSPSPTTPKKKTKKKERPKTKAETPAPAVTSPEPKKKSRIQKIKETVKVIKQLPNLTKKPTINPSLAAQALQQQLSKKTANVTAPKVNRIRDLPGRAPSFKKLDRVTRWEETSVKFPDLDYWKEELMQCVYHIPHPLVDRYVHLGIEGIREGSPCISLPAEITFGEEKPIQGTIGYTFSADGVCFHRHFTAKTSEPQKKEAASYAHYPTLSSAYAELHKTWFIEEHQCQVMEDAAGNVTFKHTQTATCGEKKIHVPITIKVFNSKFD